MDSPYDKSRESQCHEAGDMQMKDFEGKTKKTGAAVLPLLVMALAACGGSGGGGGGGTAGTNDKPTVNAGTDQGVLARTSVTLEAVASDSDGRVDSIEWTQTAGTDVTLSEGEDGAVAFTAPDLDAQETLTFKVTATDDEGATATDTVDVAVTPSVTLSAKAYDGPLPNATVTVTVGEETYTATTNEDGVFELAIGSPDPGVMITIVVNGGEGQETAELISIAGTFGALAAAAGEDGTLEPAESSSVNVTNLSTAKAVLMIEANGGEPPVDDDALTELEKSIDTDAMLELATVIKLVIDNGIALPEGVESTYDLVQEDAAIDSVIETAAKQDPDLFAQTLDSILNDPNLLPSFDAGDVPSLYFINRVGNYMYANRGFYLEFKDDGSGHIYGNGSSQSSPTTWSVGEQGELAITITEPLVTRVSCYHEASDTNDSCYLTTANMTLRLITDGATVDSITVTHTGTIEYLGAGETVDWSSTYNRLGMAPGALDTYVDEDVVGTWSVPLSTPNPESFGAEYETGLLTFNADHTGSRESGGSFDWAIDAATGVVNITFANGDTLDVYGLRDEGDMAIDAMFVLNTAGGETYAVPTFAAEVDASFAAGVTGSAVDGTWNYTDLPGLEYVLDSSAGTATAQYRDEAGAIYSGPYVEELVELAPGHFDVISWIDVIGPPPNPSIVNCSEASGDCFRVYSSTWRVLSEDENDRVFLLEVDQEWAYDPAGPDFRGAVTYRHGFNRWLSPVSTGTAGAAKPSMTRAARGEIVRGLMDERLLGRRLH